MCMQYTSDCSVCFMWYLIPLRIGVTFILRNCIDTYKPLRCKSLVYEVFCPTLIKLFMRIHVIPCLNHPKNGYNINLIRIVSNVTNYLHWVAKWCSFTTIVLETNKLEPISGPILCVWYNTGFSLFARVMLHQYTE